MTNTFLICTLALLGAFILTAPSYSHAQQIIQMPNNTNLQEKLEVLGVIHIPSSQLLRDRKVYSFPYSVSKLELEDRICYLFHDYDNDGSALAIDCQKK